MRTHLLYTTLRRIETVQLLQSKIHASFNAYRLPTLDRSTMTTPDNLLALAAELAKLGGELTVVGGKLAESANQLEQEAANLAEERAKRWGFEVQVAVGVKRGPGAGANSNTSVVEVKK